MQLEDYDEIAREFPGLSLEKIYATLTYYLAHRAEMDAYLIRIDERDEHGYQEWAKHRSPVIERMRTLEAQRVAEAMQAGAVGASRHTIPDSGQCVVLAVGSQSS